MDIPTKLTISTLEAGLGSKLVRIEGLGTGVHHLKVIRVNVTSHLHIPGQVSNLAAPVLISCIYGIRCSTR